MNEDDLECLLDLLVDDTMVVFEFLGFLNLCMSIFNSFYDVLLFFCTSASQSLLELFDGGHINEQEITWELLFVLKDLLCSLDIDLQDGNLNTC